MAVAGYWCVLKEARRVTGVACQGPLPAVASALRWVVLLGLCESPSPTVLVEELKSTAKRAANRVNARVTTPPHNSSGSAGTIRTLLGGRTLSNHSGQDVRGGEV